MGSAIRVSFWIPRTYFPHCCCRNCQAWRRGQGVVSDAQAMGRLRCGRASGREEGPMMGRRQMGTDCKTEEDEVGTGTTAMNCSQGLSPLVPTLLPEGHCSMEGSESRQNKKGPLRLVVSILPTNGQLPTETSLAISFRTVHPDAMVCTGHVPSSMIMYLQGNESCNRYNSAKTFGDVNKMEKNL